VAICARRWAIGLGWRFPTSSGWSTTSLSSVITSPFTKDGEMRFINGSSEPHKAVDIANPIGAPVVAFRGGEVKKVRQGTGEANSVTIKYNKEKGQEQLFGIYAHVESGLQPGDKVKEGQVIGRTDVSGRSTGPHLHYSQRGNDGEKKDPTQLLKNADSFPANGGGKGASPTPSGGSGTGSGGIGSDRLAAPAE